MPVLWNAVINNACRMYRNSEDRATREREQGKKKESKHRNSAKVYREWERGGKWQRRERVDEAMAK